MENKKRSNRVQGFRAVHGLILTAAICTAFVAHALFAGQTMKSERQPATAAVIPYIDAHVHLDQRDADGVRSMLETMSRQNVTKVFVLVPPYTSDDPANYDLDKLLPFAKQHPDKIAVIGGGGTLNAMIQDAVRTGDAGPEVQRKFREKAEEIMRQGAIGFGELTTEHFPSPGSATYQYAPLDHPLLLMLSDIAAKHRVPMVLHVEAVPQDMPLPPPLKSPPNPAQLHANFAALERLLAHNPRTKIIWAHAGSDNTGFRTPDVNRRLLSAYPNLLMEIKIDPSNPGKNPPLVDGKIPPDWLKLFQDFPTRFILGSDQHYPESTGVQRWQASVQLLNQLPPNLRKSIGVQNPLRIYNSKSVRSGRLY